MKKLLLGCLATLTATCAVQAQQNAGISCKWAKLIDGATSAGDQSTEVIVDNDGNVYWFGTYGTKENLPDISFGGEYLYTGALYPEDGTSMCPNYTLLKTDSEGNKLWVVYSNSGDFENNAGGAALTSDGGVVTVSKMRHTDTMLDHNIVIVDADGSQNVTEWTIDGDRRIYRLMINKINTEGKIQWSRMATLSTVPGPSASGLYSDFWGNCFNLGNCAVDNNDNLYVALNYKNPITFTCSDNTTRTYTPVNNTKWNGDSQVSCGDFMVAKFDADGYFITAFTLDGTATCANCQKLVYNNGKLYIQGYITGDGSTLHAGNFELKPSTYTSPVFICTDTDFNISWANCYPAQQVQNKGGFQNVNLRVADGKVWVCGQYNLKFGETDNDNNYLTSTQGSVREGFILKLDAATGQWLGARDSRDDNWDYPSAAAKTGLTGYLDIIVNDENPDKIYVYGYVMNQAVGVFLREYDAATLTANLNDGQTILVSKGGVPTAQTTAYDGRNGCMYCTARGNNVFALKDAETTDKPQYWGVLAAKFSMPADMKTTDVGSISMDADKDGSPVEYFNMQGVRIDYPAAGTMVIRRKGAEVTKLVVR